MSDCLLCVSNNFLKNQLDSVHQPRVAGFYFSVTAELPVEGVALTDDAPLLVLFTFAICTMQWF